MEQVNEGILDGRYSVGVTTEAAAQTLRSGGAMWIIFILRRELWRCWTARQSAPEVAIRRSPGLSGFTLIRDAQKIMAVSRNRRSVRTDTAAEKGHGSDGKAAAFRGRMG